MSIAYVGLGSNIGNKRKNLNNAVRQLRRIPGITIHTVSPFYRTKPMYLVDQQDFLNAVIKIQTILKPGQLLREIKTIEKKMGRRSSLRYGPRIIDMDILLYGRKIFKTSQLTIPHKRMHERPFVIKPLLDIAPGISHPILRKQFSALLRNLHE